MSIPVNSDLRGYAAAFPQPVNDNDTRQAEFLRERVHGVNCLSGGLDGIAYRSSGTEESPNDTSRHVFRWDLRPYQEVFENGFRVRSQQGTPDAAYYNLVQFVSTSGEPLDSDRQPYAFISTTINSIWNPTVNQTLDLYRYEIYAPGGILVRDTFPGCPYPSQNEVCFVGGIARQYIRAAQCFRLTPGAHGRHWTTRTRVDTVLRVNAFFNPYSHPQRLIRLRNPIVYCRTELPDGTRTTRVLTLSIWRGHTIRKRSPAINVNIDTDTTDWYAGDVANCESYIDAAFRSSRGTEVYLFMENEYVLLDYAPGTTSDRVVNGPLLICDGYPSLTGTAFAEYGIDCAFGSHDPDEAFIFSGDLCAHINFAPHTTNDKIIRGPITISAMFPFLKHTVFESGIDAAFESTKRYEAYLFKDNQYACINYASDSARLINPQRSITDGFPSLRDTIFASGIDAAFASHRYNEAYLFKGDSYALINFAPGTADDYIMGSVKKILPNWPSLQPILPRKNRGLDIYDQTEPGEDHTGSGEGRVHDEL